ncbi:MAG TPA: prepilin peptidase [Caulobacteraceae bacterium]
MTSSLLAHLLVVVFPIGVIVAALADATSFTIPNRLTIAIAAAFFPVALILGLPIATIGACAAVAVLALIVGIGMFAMNWCGGGDAKLLAACALWLGVPAILPFLFAMSVIGGVLALGLMTARKLMLGNLVGAGPAWLGRLLEPQEALPYGVAIALGALVAFPSSPVLAALGGH